MNFVDLLFLGFATLAVGGGVLMIFSRHPISAALFMIISMVSVAGLFVLLEAFFLAILQVLVYAGAVMVLFLFIIMLLDVGPEGAKNSRLKLVSGFAGVACFSILIILSLLLVLEPSSISQGSTLWPVLDQGSLVNGENLVFSTRVKTFGFGLFTKYMLPIQVAGFLLLAAMVGVIILSKKVIREDKV